MKLRKLALILPVAVLFACGGGPNASDQPPTTITITVTPSVLDFGQLVIGASGDMPVTISSAATSNATLSGSARISGVNFSIVGNDTSFSLNASESKIIVVRFSSTSDGLFTGTLTITHNSTSQNSPNSVQLLGTGDDQTDEINATIQSGWQLFESNDFDGAEVKFDSAITASSTVAVYESLRAEAESGRGWARAQKGSYLSAKPDFTNSLSRQNRDARTDLNSKAGLAFVHHALNEYISVIQRALDVLGADADYIFEHDSRVYHKSLRLVTAQSYYARGDFQNAAAQLDILDPGGAPHSMEPDVLLQKIQELLATI